MKSTDFLNQVVSVIIDRPLGSRHPQYGFLYTVNYGYLPDVILPDGDGEPLDAYVLGVEMPVTHGMNAAFTGRCIAVIQRLDDRDDKLVLAPEGLTFTDEEIVALTVFQEQFFDSRVLRGPSL
ncbi:MAG: inorganic diphosphatase [Anaerolineae bacterium]|nr:inorganic diphosphatase [Anaerolineae bacterium]